MISLKRLLAASALVSLLGFSTPALAQSIWAPHKPFDTGSVEPEYNVNRKIPKIDEVVKVVSKVPTHKQTRYFIHGFFSHEYPATESEEYLTITEKEIQFFSDETKGKDTCYVIVYWPQESAPLTDRIIDYTLLKR